MGYIERISRARPCEGGALAVSGYIEVGGRNTTGQLRHLNVINKVIAIHIMSFLDGNVVPASRIAVEHHVKRAERGIPIGDINLFNQFECRGIFRIGHDTNADMPLTPAGVTGIGVAGVKGDLVSVQRIALFNFREHGNDVTGRRTPIECKSIAAITGIHCRYTKIGSIGVDDIPAILEVVIVLEVIFVRQRHGFAFGFDDGRRAPIACVRCTADGTHIKIVSGGRRTIIVVYRSGVENTRNKMVVVRTGIFIRISGNVNFPRRFAATRCPAYVNIRRSIEGGCHTCRLKAA